MTWSAGYIAAGLALGTAVSILNHLMVVRYLNRVRPADQADAAKAKSGVLARYGLRYGINFVTLFVVYRNPSLLLGAGLGLTAVKNYLMVKYLVQGKG